MRSARRGIRDQDELDRTGGRPMSQPDESADPMAETTSAAGQTDGPAVGGTGAAIAGIAGGIAVAARDTRRRVLGIPLGKRSRFQRTASSVVDKATEPARKLGSRFSRD